jgi:hypothetical protein
MFTSSPAPEIPQDPFAIWQEWAIYIVIGGIVIGVIDFAMDRKLTFIGPIIMVCGFVASIWGVTLHIVDSVLPWALGAAVAVWVFMKVWPKIRPYASQG